MQRFLNTLRRRRGAGGSGAGESTVRLSLLSVVRCTGESRLMGVEEIDGDSVICAWVQNGQRHTARYPRQQLEVVPAQLAGPEEHRWREAFRAASQRKFG